MAISRTDPASGGNYGRKASPVYQLNYQAVKILELYGKKNTQYLGIAEISNEL